MAADSTTIGSLVLAAGAAIGTAARVMWKRQEHLDARIYEQGQKQADMAQDLGRLEGEQKGILNLSAGVLEEIKKLQTGDSDS